MDNWESIGEFWERKREKGSDGASLGDLPLPLLGTLQNLPALSGDLSFPLGVWLCGVLASLGDLPFPVESCHLMALI